MKLAMLIELFYPHMAGCERRFFEFGKRLSKRGHEVHVFTLQHEDRIPKEQTIEGILVHRVAHSSNYITPNGFRSLNGVLKYSFATSVRLFAKDFDIYYSNQWPMVHSIFAKLIASPLVQEWCEVWTDSQKIMTLQKILKLTSNHHVAVSEFTKRRLIDFLGLEDKKVTVIPNGVEYQKFSKGSENKVWGRIIYVGRIIPHKHVEILIDAFRKAKEKAPEIELHIVGSGSRLSSVKNQVSEVKDCFVHGFLPENRMLNLLKTAWLFVLPSEREGSSIAVLEAMAAGLPFVTVNYPNNAAKELVKFGCGVKVNPSSDSIASAINQFSNKEAMWKEMSCNARSFAKEQDWDVVTDRMESFLNLVTETA